MFGLDLVDLRWFSMEMQKLSVNPRNCCSAARCGALNETFDTPRHCKRMDVLRDADHRSAQCRGLQAYGHGRGVVVPRGENHAMLREKGPAFTEAMVASTMTAIKGGGPDKIMAAAIKPLSKKARANRKRLARRGPKTLRLSK